MKHISLRFQLVLCALILCVASLWAVPAKPGWQTKTQPDGTPVSVQLMGDEFCHYWMTQDGKIAKEQSDGTFIVMNEDIPTGEQVAQRRMASKRYQRRAKMVGSGTMPPRALFILVSFSDQTFKSTSETYYKSKLGDSAEGAMSMYNYLKLQSNGQYAPPVDVYGPYTLSNTYATYGANGSEGDGDDVDPAQMIVDACTAANGDIDFSQYDGNKDGWVDNVYVLYAGKGEADGGAASTIWPHQWNITYGKKSLMVDGKKIGAYACSAELNGDGDCAMGTPLHEYGHVIGLPDYYDTEYASTNYTEHRTPGEWSIMDGGSYNNNGNTPPNYSIFDKYYLGWETPKFLAKNAVANVTLTTDVTDGYQITGGTSRVAATATNPSTIYYIENRQKSGWDEYLPGHGMIVWQVKYSESNWSNNDLNNEGGNPRYTILSADGGTTIGNVYKNGKKTYDGAKNSFPGANIVRSVTPVTGCALTEITESGGNITFKYNGGISCHNVVVNATGCTIEPSSTCVENSTQLTATITPTDATYDFTSLTVTRGSTTLTSGTHYTLSSDKKSLIINASAISGSASDAITITAVWTKNRYSYEFESSNCTVPSNGAVSMGAALNLTITPNSGYTLADAACWMVEMGSSMLTYGTDFTYNSSTNTFSITTVTGDVTILADAGRPITWYADGNALHAKNVAVDGKITLPATDPANCASGKVFVGWCTESNYSNATTAPTFAKTGDTYSVTTYYAVYATPAGNGAPRRAKQASATYNKVTSGTITDGQYLIVYESGNVAFDGSRSTLDAASNTIAITISSSAITGDYEANEFSIDASKGTIKSASGYYIGQTANNNGMNTSTSTAYTNTLSISDGNFSVLSSGGAYLRYNSNSDQARFRYFKSSSYTSQKAIQLYKKAGSGGGGDSGGSGDYTDYSTACGTPCSNNPTMSFSPATVDKTTADEPFTKTVTITDKGSGQTVAYSSSNVTVATVDNSGKVTLKGVVGSTTITASVSADGDYCAASASYTLTVTAAPINVTLYYNGTSASLTNQTNPYTLPTGSPYNTAMCDGDWTFAGWYGSAYDKSETAPTYISQLTSTGSAYAVYTTIETSGSSGGSVTLKSGNQSGSFTIATDVTGAFAKGTGTNAPAWNTNAVRAYGGNTLTIESTSGNLTSISFTFASGEGANTITPSVGTYSGTSWTGDAASVTFKIGGSSGHRRFQTITVSGGGSSTTYYATSPECPVACELTGITLNTDNVKKTFVTNETFTSEGMVVTASYDNCVDATVTPTSVSTPVMSSVGEKTVTVSYTEGNVTKTATYKINVVAPYTVTYMACGEEFTTQTYAPGATLVLPTETPEDNAGKSFVGWINSPSYTNKTTAPTFVTAGSAVNANATYYAVYQ